MYCVCNGLGSRKPPIIVNIEVEKDFYNVLIRQKGIRQKSKGGKRYTNIYIYRQIERDFYLRLGFCDAFCPKGLCLFTQSERECLETLRIFRETDQ